MACFSRSPRPTLPYSYLNGNPPKEFGPLTLMHFSLPFFFFFLSHIRTGILARSPTLIGPLRISSRHHSPPFLDRSTCRYLLPFSQREGTLWLENPLHRQSDLFCLDAYCCGVNPGCPSTPLPTLSVFPPPPRASFKPRPPLLSNTSA